MGDNISELGIGIIGCGDEGLSNGRALREVKGVKVVALCDPAEGWHGRARSELGWGIDLFSDCADLVAKYSVDIVIVATPDDQHLKPAQAALKAGKHVFVEKPVATTLEDLRAFGVLARLYPGKLWFGEKYSFARPVEEALKHREALGEFLWGNTLYTMWDCGRIMGGGKWRTECAYNPCAGGLSHNFMTALLFSGAPIVRVRATGQVITYHENLDRYGGYDFMEGALAFINGRCLSWTVCLAIEGPDSPFGHRTVSHTFQFKHGALVYGLEPDGDRLVVKGKREWFTPEPTEEHWPGYNIKGLYARMWEGLIAAVRDGVKPRHSIEQGINVAAACARAFESAKQGGTWLEVPF